MNIDRKTFLDDVRAHLAGGRLLAHQVDGLEFIIEEFENRHWSDLRHLAYILATAWHETATRMEPVIETRRADESKNPSVDTAIKRLDSSWKAGKMKWVKTPYWRKDKDGRSWLGRGYPQVTHKDNYVKSEKATGHPFSTQPSVMLEPVPAVRVMFHMMQMGGFTGKKLDDYFSPSKDDPREARRIINALESADKVRGYHTKFLAALRKAT